MVSDELRPAPAPVGVPHQVEAEQVRARESVEASLQEARRVVSARAARMRSTSTTGSAEDSRRRHAEKQARLQQHQEPNLGEPQEPGEPDVQDWKVRPYGSRIDTALADDIAYFLKQAEAYEKKAAAARAAHQVLNERLEQERAAGASRGQQWARDAGAVLDQAVAHLTTAFEEAGRARVADAQAKQAREVILPDIAKQLQSSRIALRLAGSSRKEVQQLHEHYLGQAIGGEDERARARRASDDARLAAWESVKSSPYAEALGATGHAPALDVLAQRLADMRQQRVPEVAQAKDARDERGEHHGVVQAAMQEVKNWRGHAALAQTEQHRRRILAEMHPDFHKAEAAARVFRARLVDAQQHQQKRQAPASAAAQAAAAQAPQQKGPRAQR
ncbi:hypothetical protein [Streptomyces sp. NPDC023588]|uniref:hypothetical protein n=1 Tax=Streptomyces sp. NPDC023588 TaxID=3154907 RepID=UPI0033F44943